MVSKVRPHSPADFAGTSPCEEFNDSYDYVIDNRWREYLSIPAYLTKNLKSGVGYFLLFSARIFWKT